MTSRRHLHIPIWLFAAHLGRLVLLNFPLVRMRQSGKKYDPKSLVTIR